MESHERGDATEATVIAELKQRNIAVSLPFGDNERYDAVVATPYDRLLRVQIKTGWIRDGRIEFHGKSQHTNSTGNTYSTYEGDVDYFTVYVPESESMYLIGEWEFNTGIRLRVSEPKQSHETINWAEDFEFDQRWPPESDSRSIVHGHPALEKSIAFLRRYDLDIARTVTTDSYHLLVDTGEAVVRLGVESGWLQEGRIRFHPNSSVNYPTLSLA